MRLNLRLHVFLLLPILLLIGCAAIGINRQVAKFQRPPEYVRFFELLDRTVAETGVRDASVFTVSGFPYLRSNRFLTGLKDELNNNVRKEQWVRRMQQLDLEARQKEIHNLPVTALNDLARELGESAGRQILQQRAAFYSEKMLTHDQRLANFHEVLLRAVTDPSEYSTAMRVIGIYPVTSMPVTAVTRRVQEKFRKWHHTPAGQLAILGALTAYVPARSMEYSEQTARLVLNRSRQNALLTPRPSILDQQTLLAMFAPVINQDVAAAYDNIGEVVWRDKKVGINPARPTVYYYISHARLKGLPILQLNYVFWYSARNGQNSPWIERGPVDGITVRVSLDYDGHPIMVDIMNNCGCYHFFVPHPKKIGKMISTPDGIDAFVPRRLPESYPRKRLKLRIISGWHQVAHMDDETVATRSLPYQLAAYEQLEMLPRDDQSFKSIFNSAGIGKGSGRIEPLIFFPMGIVDIGSMRQRGHHAVKLVGREHFDEPDLFDRNFEIEYDLIFFPHYK
jgi:hypothetical protein